MKKKVVIGLSGGVDSSVAAYLLLQQGYEVIGLFMKNWDSLANNDFLGNPQTGNICLAERDYNDAQKIAGKLNIPLYRVDFTSEYWTNVFLPFINEYKKSKTPNPDILCNKFIKFDKFITYAQNKFQPDYIATGHYCAVSCHQNNCYLKTVKDQVKDQTYFLSGLKSQQLKQVLFPLANYYKTEVRKIAHKTQLITANKKDSTGICFIGKRNIKAFLQNYIPQKMGKIIDLNSQKVIGHHQGTMFYTIGQRHGLGIGGLKEPIFIIKKDVKNNILYTLPSSCEDRLFSNKAFLNKLHYINQPFLTGTYQIKFKHGLKVVTGEILTANKQFLEIKYKKERAVTPGQACVIYDNDICLGHGIVEKVYINDEKLY